LEANRRNAKRSTGPRTERGRHIAKFNAVTLGLFAKHVVIPVFDGYNAEEDFQSLLDGLHQDFQPTGFYEEWLVVKIAECMWRLRRATRCESGAVREAAIWDHCDDTDSDEVITRLATKLRLLDQAEKELRDSGTLSRKIYEQVAPLVEEDQDNRTQFGIKDAPVQTEVDYDLFLSPIRNRKKSLDSMFKSLTKAI
jgi:hypothetical protein